MSLGIYASLFLSWYVIFVNGEANPPTRGEVFPNLIVNYLVNPNLKNYGSYWYDLNKDSNKMKNYDYWGTIDVPVQLLLRYNRFSPEACPGYCSSRGYQYMSFLLDFQPGGAVRKSGMCGCGNDLLNIGVASTWHGDNNVWKTNHPGVNQPEGWAKGKYHVYKIKDGIWAGTVDQYSGYLQSYERFNKDMGECFAILSGPSGRSPPLHVGLWEPDGVFNWMQAFWYGLFKYQDTTHVSLSVGPGRRCSIKLEQTHSTINEYEACNGDYYRREFVWKIRQKNPTANINDGAPNKNMNRATVSKLTDTCAPSCAADQKYKFYHCMSTGEKLYPKTGSNAETLLSERCLSRIELSEITPPRTIDKCNNVREFKLVQTTFTPANQTTNTPNSTSTDILYHGAVCTDNVFGCTDSTKVKLYWTITKDGEYVVAPECNTVTYDPFSCNEDNKYRKVCLAPGGQRSLVV